MKVLQLVTDAGVLSIFSTTTVFGTPVDITLSELALECFFPADSFTADACGGTRRRTSTDSPRSSNGSASIRRALCFQEACCRNEPGNNA